MHSRLSNFYVTITILMKIETDKGTRMLTMVMNIPIVTPGLLKVK
jgi:hypothetical protein